VGTGGLQKEADAANVVADTSVPAARAIRVPRIAERCLIGSAKSLKRQLRQLVNLPRYGAVGLRDPQHEVEVWLCSNGKTLDVSRNNVVAALRPFTIGIMLEGVDSENLDAGPVHLCIRQGHEPKRLLGTLHIRLVRRIPLSQHSFCLFEMDGCGNFCVGTVKIGLYNLREKWRAELRQRKNSYNFRMVPLDLRCNHVFYICPRPVVLVTVEHEGAGNMFPMDLIGPTDSKWYSMALRKTSPAIRLMQESRRIALASVPLQQKAIAYEMGKHHRKTNIDWATLPFRTVPSSLYGLPTLGGALCVRDVHIQEFHEVGSHILFITTIERETSPENPLAGGRSPQLFHAFSSYRQYLAMQGPFVEDTM